MEDRHWWFRSRRRVLWALVRRAELDTSPRILDAGCGTGRNVVEFSRLGPTEGIDLSPQAVAFCHRRGLNGVRQAALEALPFEDGRFDLVLATDVLEHIEDDGPPLAELRRVAGPKGRVLITVPAYQWLWSRHDTSWQHFRRYTLGRLRDRVRANGLEPVVETYFYASILPPVAMVRTFQRLRGEPEGDAPSDLHLSPGYLDRLLEMPVRGEARLIERGGSLPAGVSVGMVCRSR
jgi:SAM-dependent methyltransferase